MGLYNIFFTICKTGDYGIDCQQRCSAIRLVFAIIQPDHVKTVAKMDGREQSVWKIQNDGKTSTYLYAVIAVSVLSIIFNVVQLLYIILLRRQKGKTKEEQDM